MKFVSIFKTLLLGVWLGSLVMLGFAVAGPIFQQLPSRTLAGALNGIILGRMNSIEWVCGIIALLLSLAQLVMRREAGSRKRRVAESVGIALAIGILWFYSIPLTDRMTALRATIGDFDHPRATEQYSAAKSEFDTLHHTYTTAVSINMLLIISSFSLSMLNFREA